MKAVRFQSQSLKVSFRLWIAIGEIRRRRLHFFRNHAGEAGGLLCYFVRVTKRSQNFRRQVRDRCPSNCAGENQQHDEHSTAHAEQAADALVVPHWIDSHGCPTSLEAGAEATRIPPDVSAPDTTCATRNPMPMGSPLVLK